MLGLFARLLRQLFLELLPRTVLPIVKVYFALLSCLLLLREDHVFHIAGALLFISTLLIVAHAANRLLFLGLHSNLLRLRGSYMLAVVHSFG